MAIAPFYSINLAGLWTAVTEDGEKYSIRLPGSLSDNSIGKPEPLDPPVLSRLTGRFEYKGVVRFYKNLTFRETDGKRYFLEVERTRQVKLFIDHTEIKPYIYQTLVAPVLFEVTGYLSGTHQICLEVSNRFTKHPSAVYESNMASKDTQTNWNGLLGDIRIREEGDAFVEKAYLRVQDSKAVLVLEVHRKEKKEAYFHLYGDLFAHTIEKKINLNNEITPVVLENLELNPDLIYWDAENPVLYPVTIVLDDQIKKINLGIRKLSYDESGTLRINGNSVFIQGDTNEAVFPDTGYPPFDRESWNRLYRIYRSFGINTVYFRSYCPPEAAFQAADELGMYVMPELSLAEPVSHFSDEKILQYYKLEASGILREYGHHPSFIFLSFGCDHPYGRKKEKNSEKKENRQIVDLNLFDEESMKKMALETLYHFCKGKDPSKLYVLNGRVLPAKGEKKTPVFELNLGHYDFLPELAEADFYDERFIGANYQRLCNRAAAFGLLQQWPKASRENFTEVTGLYEQAVNKVLLSREKNGFFLNGMQDMPGFGTHLHGFLNAHLVEKTYTGLFKKKVKSIFQLQKPIITVEKTVLSETDLLLVQFFFRNETDISATADFSYELTFGDAVLAGSFPEIRLLPRNMSYLGAVTKPMKSLLELQKEQGDGIARTGKLNVSYEKIRQEACFYFFPRTEVRAPENIRVSRGLSLEDLEYLSEGNNLLLIPESHYAPDAYWNLLVNETHPVFQYFPEHRAVLSCFRTYMENGPAFLPRPINAILSGYYGQEEKLPAYMCEFRLNGGYVFLCTLPLLDNKAPQTGALLKGIYEYMDSYDFNPRDELRVSEVRGMLEKMNEV